MKTVITTFLTAAMILLPVVGAAQLLDKPESVAFDSLNNQYLVSNIGDGAIIAIDTNGVQTPFRTGLSMCYSNCIRGETLFVSVPNGIVGLNTNTSDPEWFWPYPSTSNTDGLTTDTSGYLYAISPLLGDIYKIKISDQTHTTLVYTGLPPFPQDIVFDPRHNRLLVCSYTTNAPIIGVDIDDGSLEVVVSTPTSAHDGITIDDEGRVYLGCGATGFVYRYDSTFTNPPEQIASGYGHVAGLDFNFRDRILAVPDFNLNVVDFIDIGLPQLDLVGYTLDDGGGDGDGHADAGESLEMHLSVTNLGGEAYNVTAELSSADPYLTVTQSATTFGTALPRHLVESSVTPLAFAVDPGCPDPHWAEMTVTLDADNEGGSVENFYIYIGETPGFEDDTESGEGYWTHSPVSPGYNDQWHLDTYRMTSGATSWKAGGIRLARYLDMHDGGLLTPPVLLPEEATLTFWHWGDIEEDEIEGLAWDGAIIMIGTGDGQWTQLTPVGGYSHTIIDNPASPFEAGTPCWSGNFDWTEVEVDLSAYTGVYYIMFRLGSDVAATEEGWYVDDISIRSPSCCGQYTGGFTGNTNCDPDGKITLSDISRLIDRVFISREPLCCEENGNANGSEDGKLTLSDISRLIDNVFVSKEPTAACP